MATARPGCAKRARYGRTAPTGVVAPIASPIYSIAPSRPSINTALFSPIQRAKTIRACRAGFLLTMRADRRGTRPRPFSDGRIFAARVTSYRAAALLRDEYDEWQSCRLRVQVCEFKEPPSPSFALYEIRLCRNAPAASGDLFSVYYEILRWKICVASASVTSSLGSASAISRVFARNGFGRCCEVDPRAQWTSTTQYGR